jgi:hypothetical protein
MAGEAGGVNIEGNAAYADTSAEKECCGSIIITNNNSNQHPNTSNEHADKPNWVEQGTLFVLALTLIAAGYAGYQAGRLADLTHDIIVDGRKESAIQSRAYVSIRSIDLKRNNDDTFDVIPQWENSGNSPAIRMITAVSYHAPVGEMPNDFVNFVVGHPTFAQITLGQKEYTAIAYTKISKQCMIDFNNRVGGVKHFYFWGGTRYYDTISDVKHRTKFCWDVNRFVPDNDWQNVRISYGLCGKGNCMDDDCEPEAEAKEASMPLEICGTPPTPP